MNWHLFVFSTFTLLYYSHCLLPPDFQWKVIDYAWQGKHREAALASGAYVPENNMPTGLARWKDKLFITVPRWKRGVPSSLNYVHVNGNPQQVLHPYPSWADAFVCDDDCCVSTNCSVVSAYKIHVDKCDRLWVVDNGVTDMLQNVKQISPPSILVFDLNKNTLKYKHVFDDELLRDSTVFTSIVVDIVDTNCRNAYAYISDMGSGALVVYDLRNDTAWRHESPLFMHQENASIYNIGGIEFFWHDGVSSVALSQKDNIGYRDLFCHPTSSTKLLKISTKLLRNPYVDPAEFRKGVQVVDIVDTNCRNAYAYISDMGSGALVVYDLRSRAHVRYVLSSVYGAGTNGIIVGDRGPLSQATACDYDSGTNVLFYTQVSKNGVGCWNLGRDFTPENTPLLLSDCQLLEFPNDIKVDAEGDVWILSDRQPRFLYGRMDPSEVNFRVVRAPAALLVRSSRCRLNAFERFANYFKP